MVLLHLAGDESHADDDGDEFFLAPEDDLGVQIRLSKIQSELMAKQQHEAMQPQVR
jgi:hypothetical protein